MYGGNDAYYQADLNYTFPVMQEYSGVYSRQFDLEEDAKRFANMMLNESILVRYRPEDPRKSVVLKRDIDSMLQSGRLIAKVGPPALLNLSAVGRKFFQTAAIAASLGFLASLAALAIAWTNPIALPQWFFLAIVVGSVISLLPTFFIAHRLTGSWSSELSWKAATRNCPHGRRWPISPSSLAQLQVSW